MFSGINPNQSPFFVEQARLIASRDRLTKLAQSEAATLTRLNKTLKDDDALKAGDTKKLSQDQRTEIEDQVACLQAGTAQIQAVIDAIKAFLTGLVAQQQAAPQQGNNAQGETKNPPPQGGAKNGSQVASNLPQIVHIISADGLARALGLTPDNPDIGSDWHILTLKALESGGSVFTHGNLFTGKRTYFSGGAVATYALFVPGGGLECSGNVYDYGGHIKESKFRREFRKANIDPICSYCSFVVAVHNRRRRSHQTSI